MNLRHLQAPLAQLPERPPVSAVAHDYQPRGDASSADLCVGLDKLKDDGREATPFELVVEQGGEERRYLASAVIDAVVLGLITSRRGMAPGVYSFPEPRGGAQAVTSAASPASRSSAMSAYFTRICQAMTIWHTQPTVNASVRTQGTLNV